MVKSYPVSDAFIVIKMHYKHVLKIKKMYCVHSALHMFDQNKQLIRNFYLH